MTRFLLVDDSSVMRHFVARALRMTGLEISIDEAENGMIAIEKAYKIKPHIIITDLSMPEMSGQELVALVHAAPELRGTRVLVLSADRSDGRFDEMVRAGAVAYLTKPASPEKLKNSVMQMLTEGT